MGRQRERTVGISPTPTSRGAGRPLSANRTEWAGYAKRLRQEFKLHAGAIAYIGNVLNDAKGHLALHEMRLEEQSDSGDKVIRAAKRAAQARRQILLSALEILQERDRHGRPLWPKATHATAELRSILYGAPEGRSVSPILPDTAPKKRARGRPGATWVRGTVEAIARVLSNRGTANAVSAAIYDGLKLSGLAGTAHAEHAVVTKETIRHILQPRRRSARPVRRS